MPRKKISMNFSRIKNKDKKKKRNINLKSASFTTTLKEVMQSANERSEPIEHISNCNEIVNFDDDKTDSSESMELRLSEEDEIEGAGDVGVEDKVGRKDEVGGEDGVGGKDEVRGEDKIGVENEEGKLEEKESKSDCKTPESEDEILNKYDTAFINLDTVDSVLEDELLNEDKDAKIDNKINSNLDLAVNKLQNKNTSNNIEETTICQSALESIENSKDVSNKKTDDINVKETKMEGVEEEVRKEKLPNDKDSKLDLISENQNENSRDSTKSQNLDSEDLMDISIIRDADEDAENAYNEEQSALKEGSEDSEDKRSDRTEEEDEQTMKSSSRVSCEENTVCEGDSDVDGTNVTNSNSGSDDIGESVVEKSVINNGIIDANNQNSNKKSENKENENCDNTRDGLQSVLDKEIIEGDSEVSQHTNEEGKEINLLFDKSKRRKSNINSSFKNKIFTDTTNCISEKRNERKRTLSTESNHSTEGTKKSKLDESIKIKNKLENEEQIPKLQTLFSFSEFMKDKHLNMLTRSALEEFCLQKVCEAMIHKSELGNVHQQLRMQEHMIDTMKKDLQQLTKQARDLEIVNKKLMNDLKQQNVTNKPLTPLKITRSVGLQVKLIGTDSNSKRRVSNVTNTPKNQPVNNNNNNKNRNIPVTTNVAANKQVTPQKTVQTKSNTPILSHVLQNRRQSVNDATNKGTPQVTRTKPATELKNSSFIDLTDDDDKKEKSNALNKMTPQRNTMIATRSPRTLNTVKATPVRTVPLKIATSQGKTAVTSSSQSVMYVVQSNSTQSVGGTQKAVLLNLQTTNGVITPTLNGSAVSVIPKSSNTIQLKTVPSIKSAKICNKHPAPLPPPPLVRINGDKALKPVPPKPHLTIRKTDTGIILQWKMPYELDLYENIASYQLYAYQETTAAPSTDMWRRVGDVKALALPMACTLTQFADKNKYYFAVRPVDIHKRIGAFSEPEEISL